MAALSHKVEIAWTSGYSTPAASRSWTDVTAYVQGEIPLSITRGRQDEYAQIPPSQLTITFDNLDGRFTPDNTSGAYYPNVKMGRPIRVTTTLGGVDYVRFVGYITEWPVVWPNSTDLACDVTVSATSRTARLGRGAELGQQLDIEILADSPSLYWPMGEESGATAAAEMSGNGRARLASGTVPPPDGGPAFGADTLVVFGNQSVAWTDAVLAADLAASLPNVAYNAGEAMFLVDPGVIVAPLTIITLEDSTEPIYMDTSGFILAGGISSSATYNDGAPHHVAFRYSGGTLTLYVDGVSVGSGAATSVTSGSVRVGTGFVGRISNVALWATAPTEARLQAHAEAALTGFSGDTPGSRLTLFAERAGVAATETDFATGTTTIGAIDTTGQTPISLMSKVAETDGGVLYDAKDGTLTFASRDVRYQAPVAFTLDVDLQEVEGDLQPKKDDQFLVNDVTGNGVEGADSVFLENTSSSDEYGFYKRTLDLATPSSDEVLAAAQWALARGIDPPMRFPTVTVDVRNSGTSLAADILTADIGTRFGVDNLPDQAPSATADLFVEGYTETIGFSVHRITFNTSPTDGYSGTNGVFQLDVTPIDSTYVLAL